MSATHIHFIHVQISNPVQSVEAVVVMVFRLFARKIFRVKSSP